MKKISLTFRWILIIAILIIVKCFFYFNATPVKDGLYIKYETRLRGLKEKAVHEFCFKKEDKGYYQVDIKSTGFLKSEQIYKVDKNFMTIDKVVLPGPAAAVIWIPPYLLWKGNNTSAGEVIKYATWEGYDSAVIQDLRLGNCYGYYDRRTGLQVGYYNCWSPQKLITVIKETNAK